MLLLVALFALPTTAFADTTVDVIPEEIVALEAVEETVETVETVETSMMSSEPMVMAMAATTSYVAEVNGNQYTTLSAAITAAGSNGTVKLIDDVTLTSYVIISNSITLDLNGYTITGALQVLFQIDGEVTITDTSDDKDGKITSTYGSSQVPILVAYGCLNFTGGIIESNYVGMQVGTSTVNPSGQSSMSGTAAIDATFCISKVNTNGMEVSGGYLSSTGGNYVGTLADGYGIFALAETEGVFEGLYKVYELTDVAKIGDKTYGSFIDAVEASAYGDAVVLTADVVVAQPFTLRTGTTFSVENDEKLYLTENTSVMNCSNSDVTVYYNGDAYTVAAGDLYTAKTLGDPTNVDTEAGLIAALKEDAPYIVMTDDITINESSLSQAYVVLGYTGTLDGGGYTLTLSGSDDGFNLVQYPEDGMVIQNLDVKITGQASALSSFIWTSGARVVFDNITIVDSGEVFTVGNNWSPFTSHNFGHFIMKDCVNEQNFSGTGYQAIFIGGYMYAGSTTAYVDCINYGSLIGEDVAFFLGNPTKTENDVAVTDIYITGFVNYGTLRGSDTANPFSKNGGSSNLDYLNVLIAEEWAYQNEGIVEVAAAYDFSGAIDKTTGIISIIDETTTGAAASYGVRMWGYATIANGGGTSSTFAVVTADSLDAFNEKEFRFGTIIDDITFASEHEGVETYVAPWGENEFTSQPYEIAVIGGTMYYVFDINDNCTLNNTSPRVDIYAYDEYGYLIGSKILSSTGVSAVVPDIVCTINDAAYIGTFVDAVASASDGDIITLLEDTEVSSAIKIEKNITIQGVTGTETISASFNTGENNGLFVVADGVSATFKNLTFTVDDFDIITTEGGTSATLTVDGCTFNSDGSANSAVSGDWSTSVSIQNNVFNNMYNAISIDSWAADVDFTLKNNVFTEVTYAVDLDPDNQYNQGLDLSENFFDIDGDGTGTVMVLLNSEGALTDAQISDAELILYPYYETYSNGKLSNLYELGEDGEKPEYLASVTVGDKEYDCYTWEAVLAVMDEGATVDLYDNVEIDKTVVLDKSVTIDGGDEGYTISTTGVDPVFKVTDEDAEITIQNCEFEASDAEYLIYSEVAFTLTFENNDIVEGTTSLIYMPLDGSNTLQVTTKY